MNPVLPKDGTEEYNKLLRTCYFIKHDEFEVAESENFGKWKCNVCINDVYIFQNRIKQGNWNITKFFKFRNDDLSQDPSYTKYSRTTAEGRRTWAAIEEFNDSLKILKNTIEVTLEYEEKPYQYPDTRPSIIAARQLHDLLGFPEYNFRIFMRYIEWCPGTARFFIHLIKVTLSEIVLIHEKDIICRLGI